MNRSIYGEVTLRTEPPIYTNKPITKTDMDSFIKEVKHFLTARNIVNQFASDYSFCEYVIVNHFTTVLEILEKNIPSSYDLTIIQVVSASTSLYWVNRDKIITGI